MADDRETAVVSAGRTKREYRKPRLIELGALRDITLNVGRKGRRDGFKKWRTAP
jgi:hypothetical protein